jgi:DNA-binding FadR family transcriptional regulator
MVQGRTGQRRRLSQDLVEALGRSIAAGKLGPGARLPTETQLGELYGVSRTVVREAVATLRARGLVEARQGSGVYVTAAQPVFGLGPLAGGSAGLTSILDLLELRAPLEIEAAALAAVRRTGGQDLAIRLAFERLGAAITLGESAAEKDFDFHLAVAEATNNRNFVEVLTFLGQRTIPRGTLGSGRQEIDRSYLDGVQSEHRRIAEAISDQDAAAAREEMRKHLIGSQLRYRMLLAAAQTPE